MTWITPFLGPIVLAGLFAVLVHADPVNEVPKRISEFKTYVREVKPKLPPKAFANRAKRDEYDKALAELKQQVGDFRKFAKKLNEDARADDVVARYVYSDAHQALGEGYMLLVESAWIGCDYQTVKDAADLAPYWVAKDTDRTQLLHWKAMAQVRLLRFADAEGTCKELGSAGGQKQAAQVLASAKNQTGLAKPGKPISSFGFRAVAGEKVAVPEAYSGRVLLIDFWSTGDAPSKAEMPDRIALYHELHEKGFDIVGISLDTNAKSLKAYVEANKMPWPQCCDGLNSDQHIAKYFGVTSLPHTILVDKTGSVKSLGLRGPELAQEVRELLGIKK